MTTCYYFAAAFAGQQRVPAADVRHVYAHIASAAADVRLLRGSRLRYEVLATEQGLGGERALNADEQAELDAAVAAGDFG